MIAEDPLTSLLLRSIPSKSRLRDLQEMEGTLDFFIHQDREGP